MKNIKILVMLLACIIMSVSCDNWLDVQPKTEVKSDVMFETTQGFKDALIGSYLLMTKENLYGREITYGFIDALSQHYDLESLNPYEHAENFDYKRENVRARIDGIWGGMYNVIANLNNIILNLDSHKDNLNPADYSIIKGECLGLRAFLHFDLFRIFGKGNIQSDNARLKILSIPFLSKYSKDIPEELTGEIFFEKILKDTEEAERLLSEYDPNSFMQNQDILVPNEDNFYSKRNKRFNYTALKLLQARIYLWKGDWKKSLECAKIVTEHPTASWITDTRINNEEVNNRDYGFSCEYIFCLDIVNMGKQTANYFVKPEINKNYSLLYHTKAHAQRLFEVDEGIGKSDYRFTSCYDKSDQYLFLKLKSHEDFMYKDQMPIMKLPESYYIAAECENNLGNRKNAVKYLNKVRQNRGIIVDIDEESSKEQIAEEIQKEYMKDFLCEGQLFFFYKRLGKEQIEGSAQKCDDKIYVLPLPEKEIEFGGRKTK